MTNTSGHQYLTFIERHVRKQLRLLSLVSRERTLWQIWNLLLGNSYVFNLKIVQIFQAIGPIERTHKQVLKLVKERLLEQNLI